MATAATNASASRRARGSLDAATSGQVIDLAARRRAALERDDCDPERWLDDAAMVRAQEVSTWPAPR
ncbi:MAG: hypothetical protein QOH87_2485 [Trebonia sp.]|jgi:hypothetical protein|nr:hypothetical protein [Trebonia sp.]